MRAPLRLLLAAALSLLLAGWFGVTYREALPHLPWSTWHLSDFVGPACLLLLSHLLRAARLHAELRSLSFAASWRLLAYHTFWVNLLPMRSGELALPLLLHRNHQIPLMRATATLLWLRAQDLLVLLLLAILLWPGLSLAVRGVALAALAAFLLLLPLWFKIALSLPFPWLGKLVSALQIAIAQSHSVWHWTIANWCVKIAGVGWLLATLLSVGWAEGLSGALAGEWAAIQPVQGIAGFGPYEAAVAALLHSAYDVPVEAAAIAGLAAHLLLLAVSSLMAFFALIGKS